jgi:hypothetical protein
MRQESFPILVCGPVIVQNFILIIVEFPRRIFWFLLGKV